MAKKFYIKGSQYLAVSRIESSFHFTDFEMQVLELASQSTELKEKFTELKNSMHPLIKHHSENNFYRNYELGHFPVLSLGDVRDITEGTASPRIVARDIELVKNFPKLAQSFIDLFKAEVPPLTKIYIEYDDCKFNMDAHFSLSKLEGMLSEYIIDYLPELEYTFSLNLADYKLQEYERDAVVQTRLPAFYLLARDGQKEGFVKMSGQNFTLTQEMQKAHIFFQYPEDIDDWFESVAVVKISIELKSVPDTTMQLAARIEAQIEKEKIEAATPRAPGTKMHKI